MKSDKSISEEIYGSFNILFSFVLFFSFSLVALKCLFKDFLSIVAVVAFLLLSHIYTCRVEYSSLLMLLILSSLESLSIKLDTMSIYTSVLLFLTCSTSCFIFSSSTTLVSILSPSHSLIVILEVKSSTSISHMLSLSSLESLSFDLDTMSSFTLLLLFVSCSTYCLISFLLFTRALILSPSHLLIGTLEVLASLILIVVLRTFCRSLTLRDCFLSNNLF